MPEAGELSFARRLDLLVDREATYREGRRLETARLLAAERSGDEL